MCSPSPPPAPDYAGAAREQGAANAEAARISGRLNNPNVIGPNGTQTVTFGGGFDQAGYDKAKADWDTSYNNYLNAWNQWDRGGRSGAFNVADPRSTPVDKNKFYKDPDQVTIEQKLSPDQQKLLDTGNQAKIGLSELALQGTGLAKGVLGNSLDFSNLPGMGASSAGSRAGVLSEMQGGLSAMPEKSEALRERIANAMMARPTEDAARSQRLLESDLAARGIGANTDAYRDAMALEGRKLADAKNQAYLSAGQEMSRDFGLDMARRQQGVSEYGQAANIGLQGSQLDTNNRRTALAELLTERQTPINEITALMSGSQVNNPFSMPGYAQNANVQPAPVFAAQNALSGYNTDLYNAKAAQAGNLQQGLFGLGTAGLTGGMMLM